MSKKPRHRRICIDCKKNQAIYAQQTRYPNNWQLRIVPIVCQECLDRVARILEVKVFTDQWECRKYIALSKINGQQTHVCYYRNPKAYAEVEILKILGLK